MYYLAGLSPFEKNMLKQKTGEIENILRHAFNKDLIDMLSAVKESPRWDDGGNAWAHKDNWLEELVEDPQKTAPKKIEKKAEVSEQKISPKSVSERGYTILQLGAYRDMQNAMDDLKAVRSEVEALKGYDIFIEDAEVNGVLYHRLLVKPEAEKLADLCRMVTDAGFDCLLK